MVGLISLEQVIKMDEIGESLGNALGLGVLAVGAGITLKAMNNLVESSNNSSQLYTKQATQHKRVKNKSTNTKIKPIKIKPIKIKPPKIDLSRF